MYAHVSKEEWMFRGLALAMVLAMVGMAVMPVVGSGSLTIPHQSNAGYGLMIYGLSRGNTMAFEIGMAAWEISDYIMPFTPYGALAKLGLML
jgi:hypothetical protein